MSSHEKLVNALKVFNKHIDTTGLYDGGNDHWFAINESDDRLLLAADNTPLVNRVQYQVHYYLPSEENYIAIKRRIRNGIFRAGFSYPTVDMLVEEETKLRHIIFEFEIAEDTGYLEESEE